MTIETLLKSDLTLEFERAAKSSKRDAADVLAEFMSEYIESVEDSHLFDLAEKAGRKSGYTEEDAVEMVRQTRCEQQVNQ